MADLTGSYVANNYQKAFAPFTRFGTRELAFFYIDVDLPSDTMSDEELSWGTNGNQNPWYWPDHANEYEHNGYFAQTIRAIQQKVELYGVFRPDSNDFIFVVAGDTANTGGDNPYNMNNMAETIADAVSNALDTSVTVSHQRIRGRQFRYTASEPYSLSAPAAPDAAPVAEVPDAVVVKGTPSAEFAAKYVK